MSAVLFIFRLSYDHFSESRAINFLGSCYTGNIQFSASVLSLPLVGAIPQQHLPVYIPLIHVIIYIYMNIVGVALILLF